MGLLEQRELAARRRVDELREEADREEAELAVAERDWKEWPSPGPGWARYWIRPKSSSFPSRHRAIAMAELDGPEVALAAVGRLEDELAEHHAYHATRADLLRRLCRGQQSRAAYDKPIELTSNTAETAYLTRRRDQLR
ncbi:hypothetical protein ACIBI8_16535 [Streptomyces sp. NPDC050529]|uniref:hypothetical protein n=1 Tax=Streptomyces sp. NPDC050529 TaxID=3365624 RepID=UPI00378BB912